MNWAWDNRGLLVDLTSEHMFLAFVPVLVGLLLAVPLGVLAYRAPGVAPALLGLGTALVAVPSIALFVFLPALFGTRIDDRVNVVVALSVLALGMLVRAVVEGLRRVPGPVSQAADAMGFSPSARLLRVELPVAMPVLFAGLRTLTTMTISLVSMGALVGVGGLGELFTDGFRKNFESEVLVGIALSALLALGADQFFVRLQRALLPWAKPVPVT